MQEKNNKNSVNQIYYTSGEEWFNIISHIVGAGLAVVAAVLMITKVSIFAYRGKYSYPALAIIAICLYGVSLMVMYLFSSLYHSRKHGGKPRVVFRRFDHCAIPILIAGTYAPFTLIGLVEYGTKQPADFVWGIVIASVVLATAVLTLVFNAINPHKFRKYSMIAYITMGWCVLIRIFYVIKAIGFWASIFLGLGGVVYTIGILFYSCKKIKFNHAIWHLFVLFGSIFHFMSVFFYLI